MPQGRSGVSVKTAPNMVLDAGQVVLNIDLTALETAGSDPWGAAIGVSGAIPLGGTRGGSVFNPNRTIRQMPADGGVGPFKGFNRRQNSAPTLTVNLLEITVENLMEAIAGANQSTQGDFTRIVGGEIEDSDYIGNVAIATTIKGDPANPVVLVLQNVMVIESPEFSFSDEDELVLPVTFAAHVDVSTPNTEAWRIYHPGTIVPA